jgi:hypothetical protein
MSVSWARINDDQRLRMNSSTVSPMSFDICRSKMAEVSVFEWNMRVYDLMLSSNPGTKLSVSASFSLR